MRELPTGTVTFLFTDLEGSTRLWEQHPDAMRDALARHDQILRAVIEAQDGVVFSEMGDGMAAAFPSAPCALHACLDAQLGLLNEAWDDTPLKARMGLHAGDGLLRADGQYVNAPLNRCARLMAVAHGGQVVLSDAVEVLVRDALPADTALLDLGEHRLRDLANPMRVYQLAHPHLPRDFPRLKSLGRNTNLPVQLTTFVGRERELEELAGALTESRIVTLTGVGGVGKTRLALQVAAEALPQFPDGAWLVELAPVSEPDAVADTIATALDTQLVAEMPVVDAVCEDLRRRRLLLVIDNCEHLLDRVADLVGRIAHECPGVAVLATSREGLALPGERIFAVTSLGLPDAHATIEDAPDAEAVQLFADRASAVRTEFSLTTENVAGVVAICRRLDGVPLALELAAARVTSLHPAQIAERLDERFRLLTAGRRTAVGRHQTLRATIDWSYDLLTAEERVALNRLAVFAGGCTLDAAEAALADDDLDRWEVIDLLGRLVEQSLLVADESGGEARYRLLETIRQYAAERLAEAGDVAETLSRHAAYYGSLASAIGAGLRGPDEAAWCARYEVEVENLRGAVTWFAEQDEADDALRLVIDLFPLTINTTVQTVPDLAAAALEAPSAQSRPLAPAAMTLVAERLFEQGDEDGALALFDEAAALSAALGTPPHILEYYTRFRTAMTRNDLVESGVQARAYAAVADVEGDPFTRAWSLVCLAAQESVVGEHALAVEHFRDATAFARATGNPSCIVTAVGALAWTVRDEDPEVARPLLDEAVAAGTGTNTLGFGSAIANRFIVNAMLGETGDAIGDGRSTADAQDRTYERNWNAGVFVHTAIGLVELGRYEAAARTIGAAEALALLVADPPPAFGWQPREARIRAALGEETYQALVADGRTLDKDAAVELLRRELDAVEAELARNA